MVGRESCGFGIKGPHDHPVGANLDGWAFLVIRIGITSLCGSGQHVNDAWNCVGRFGLVLEEITEPLH